MVSASGIHIRSWSGVATLLVVRGLLLKRVHIRLYVEDPRFEFSECLEQIHSGVDEHVDPDRGVLTLPELTQRFDTPTEALGLASDLGDPLPRALEGVFELLQRVPQRGQQVPRLVRLIHTAVSFASFFLTTLV